MKPNPTGQGILHTKCILKHDHEFAFSWELETFRDGATNAAKDYWCFSVVEDKEAFQFELVDEGNYMRVQNMHNNGHDRYKAKGIPEAFIRLSYDLFKIPIGSSREGCIGSQAAPKMWVKPEQQSPSATKAWERLVSSGEAYKDENQQRFFYPKP